MNDKFYAKLTGKLAIYCLPNLLSDSILDYLYNWKKDIKAKDLLKLYAASVYCMNKQVHPTSLTNEIFRRDNVVKVYEVYIIFEKFRRLGLIGYKVPTIDSFYSVPLNEIQYVRTDYCNKLFPKE